MKLYLPTLLMLFSFVPQSCKKLVQYHPNEVRLEESERNLNAKNILRLSTEPKRGSFRFAVIGDSQRFYDDLADVVKTINSYPDISFALLNGDITDFGLNREYKWVIRELNKLVIPFIGVIGNHDMLANGRKLYQQMFGPENFTFSYNDYNFVCLNSNSREVGFNGSIPDTAWLRHELNTKEAQAQKGMFVFSHIPPTDSDFDPRLSEPYARILANSQKVTYSIHAHQHQYSSGQPFGPPVNYLAVGNVEKRMFLLFTVYPDTTHVEKIIF